MNKSDKIGCGIYFITFLLVIVVLVQTVGLGYSNSFFDITNEAVSKVSWLADKVYDVSRDWLGFGDSFVYADEVYLFRLRFVVNEDKENDPYNAKAECHHYADFLVKADDSLARKWTMVYCTVPDVIVTWKVVVNNLLIDIRPKSGEWFAGYQFSAVRNWDDKMILASHSYDVTKLYTSDGGLEFVPLTYRSYLINIRLHDEVTYYDFATTNAFIKDGLLT